MSAQSGKHASNETPACSKYDLIEPVFLIWAKVIAFSGEF